MPPPPLFLDGPQVEHALRFLLPGLRAGAAGGPSELRRHSLRVVPDEAAAVQGRGGRAGHNAVVQAAR